MSNQDDTSAAPVHTRTMRGGWGIADVDAPQPGLDLTDPEVIRALGEFNAGVQRAKDEYAEFPFIRSVCGGYHPRRDK